MSIIDQKNKQERLKAATDQLEKQVNSKIHQKAQAHSAGLMVIESAKAEAAINLEDKGFTQLGAMMAAESIMKAILESIAEMNVPNANGKQIDPIATAGYNPEYIRDQVDKAANVAVSARNNRAIAKRETNAGISRSKSSDAIHTAHHAPTTSKTVFMGNDDD